jgi:hypothetical protein
MKDYYAAKMPDTEPLLEPNPQVVVCDSTRENLRKLAAFSEGLSLSLGPSVYNKKTKRYESFRKSVTEKYVTKANLAPTKGKQEYEFSPKVI